MTVISDVLLVWRDPRFIALRMIVKFGVAVYTLVTLVTTWTTLHDSKLSMSTTAPSDYCVPFFDTVNALAKTSVPTRAAYDYVLGLAVVRLCTNYSREQLAPILDGYSSEYDPMTALGCPLNNATIQDVVNRTCTIEGNIYNLTCWDVISAAPAPTGYNWRYSPELAGPNCQIRFSLLGQLPPCSSSYVASYARYQPTALQVSFATIFIPVGITGLQLLVYAGYWFTRNDAFLAYVGEGLLVPFAYAVELFVVGRPWPDLDASMHPLATAMLILQALAEGLVCPIVATYGCGLPRYPKQLALLIVKCILVLYFVCIFVAAPIMKYCLARKEHQNDPAPYDSAATDKQKRESESSTGEGPAPAQKESSSGGALVATSSSSVMKAESIA